MTRTAQYTKLNIKGIEKQLPDYIINLFNKHEKYIKSEIIKYHELKTHNTYDVILFSKPILFISLL